MERLNYLLFFLVNVSEQASGITISVAEFAARWLVPAAAAAVIAPWVWGAPSKRGALLAAGAGMLIGLGINQVVGLLWFHPRPFMVGVGRTLMPMPARPPSRAIMRRSFGAWASAVGETE